MISNKLTTGVFYTHAADCTHHRHANHAGSPPSHTQHNRTHAAAYNTPTHSLKLSIYLHCLRYTLTKAFCHSCCLVTTARHIWTHTNGHMLLSFWCRLSIPSQHHVVLHLAFWYFKIFIDQLLNTSRLKI